MSQEYKERRNARRRMLSANKSEKDVEPKGYKGMSYEEELRRNKEEIRKSRANKSEEEKNEELRKNKERIRKYRANKSEEETIEELRKNRERIRKSRAERKEGESEHKDAWVTEFEKINLKNQLKTSK